MILPALTGLTVAAGLLLRGSWDLWAQSIIHLVAAAGTGVWLVRGALRGRVPFPGSGRLGWAGGLAALGALSALRSPVHALAFPECFNLLNALWIFLAVAVIPRDRRAPVDGLVRVAAWALMLLAFYQRAWECVERPSSALVNQNVYAGAILMLIPFAAEKKDWPLLAGLLVNLWWAKSAGAWLALLAASAMAFSLAGRGVAFGRSLAALAGAACLVLIAVKLRSPDLAHRWQWWSSALAMIRDRPLLGCGPGTFAYVLPGYRETGGLATLYAHQYYFQVAAEYGLPFAALWFGGLWSAVRGKELRRVGVWAILLHSAWDWSLSMPANLWLFSYLCASGTDASTAELEVPRRFSIPACLAAAVAGVGLCLPVWNLWAADRWKVRARAALAEGDLPEARRASLKALDRSPLDAEPHLLLGSLRPAEPPADPGVWAETAGHLEAAAGLNPYRAQTWSDLSAAYLRIGDPVRSRQALERGAGWCPRLRALPASGTRSAVLL